jgi:hypothetical protein
MHGLFLVNAPADVNAAVGRCYQSLLPLRAFSRMRN